MVSEDGEVARPGKRGRLLQEVLVFLFFLLPLVSELWMLRTGQLGGHPVAQAEQDLGLWAFRFLLMTLAITPLRRFTGISLMHWRRVTGLLAFTYALFHAGIFVVVQHHLNAVAIWHAVTTHPFLIAGIAALFILTLLAVTSQRVSMRKLGRKWKSLHRAVYPAAVLVALHYLLFAGVKGAGPLIYAALTALLLLARL